jgi:hypothetical protein
MREHRDPDLAPTFHNKITQQREPFMVVSSPFYYIRVAACGGDAERLADYPMQIILLEQQNKKRLMARNFAMDKTAT